MLYSLAFIALGFLIGNLVGMTSSSAVSALIPLLFAFGGGSAVAFLQKLDRETQRRASVAIISLSIACLVGTYTGIVVSEYQLLSPATNKPIPDKRVERTYLRSSTISLVNAIDAQRTKGNLTTEQAYDKLKQGILQLTQKSDKQMTIKRGEEK